MNVSLIIAAAGSSKRMGGSVKKQYLLLKNLPVLIRSVKAFCAFKEIIQIIVVCPSEDEYFVKELLSEYKLSCQVVCGGEERQDSIRNALKVLNEKTDYVLIHDGARPFVGEDVIESILGELKKGAKAVVPGVRPKNTIRTKTKTLNRDELFEVQTPQGFEKNCLIDAYKKAFDENFYGTDDAGLVERLGVEVVISKGSYKNIKITTKEDLEKEMRIGQGYDVHKMVEGRKLMLGCTEIPYEKGLLGHSDADVLSHAIADALLGAAALGDIGKIFPDTAKETEGMPGSEILKQTMELLRCRGFEIANIDSTIVAQKPKLMPYIDKMRENIATALEIDKEFVSVKATTEEGLGFTGDGNAMSAQAICIIKD